MKNYSGAFTPPVIIMVLLVGLGLLFLLWVAIDYAFGADVNETCLTREQARVKYPGQWLYWHTANRCWDNVNVRSTHARSVAAAVVSRPATWGKQNSLKLPKPIPDANGNAAHHSGRPVLPEMAARGPTVFYPSLMAGGGTDDGMLRAESMTMWPTIADFDVDPPQFIPWQQRIAALFDQAQK